MTDICKIIKDGISNDSERELLAQSLFYYCCGADPTPVIALGSNHPLYIYSDIIDYGNGSLTEDDSFDEDKFNETVNILYERLKKAGFACAESRRIKLYLNPKSSGNAQIFRNIDITLWKTKEARVFSLVYMHLDAVEAFKKIYSDGSNNYIQPKCICNYRYEFIGRDAQSDQVFFSQIEKRTEFIMGYCFNDKYKCISEHKYYGDYEENTKVKLFQRRFWYVY